MTPRRLSLAAHLSWLLPALALAATLPLEGRGQQAAKPPVQQVAPPQTTGTATPGRPSTPQAAGNPSGGRGDQRRNQPDWLWWQDPEVKKELVLTERQVRDIDRLYQTRAKETKPIVEEYSKQGDELQKMRREYLVTAETYRLQVIRVQALESEINISRSVTIYKMYLVLNADQRAKMAGIWEKRRGRGNAPGS